MHATTRLDRRVVAMLEVRRQRLKQAAMRRQPGSLEAEDEASGPDGGGGSKGAKQDQIHHNDLQGLPGHERTAEYVRRLQQRAAEEVEVIFGDWEAVNIGPAIWDFT